MIIGITGLRKSGKSTAAKFIKDYNSSFIRVAFADQLKDEVAEQYSIPVEDLYDNYKKEQYRKLLQDHGAMRRKENPNYWIERCHHVLSDPAKLICVEDVRFFNEIGSLSKLGACFIRVKCNDKVRKTRGWVYDSVADTHPSELELLDISDANFVQNKGAIIVNHDGLEDFRNKINQVLLGWNVKAEVLLSDV